MTCIIRQVSLLLIKIFLNVAYLSFFDHGNLVPDTIFTGPGPCIFSYIEIKDHLYCCVIINFSVNPSSCYIRFKHFMLCYSLFELLLFVRYFNSVIGILAFGASSRYTFILLYFDVTSPPICLFIYLNTLFIIIISYLSISY